MVYSLLYVSKALLEPAELEAELPRIAAVSLARNAALGITGTLVSTGGYFAQLLEGSPEAVDAVMCSISADPRHMRLKIIRRAGEERRFTRWMLAYYVSAGFGERHIAPFFAPLSEATTLHLGSRLVTLMQSLTGLSQV